MSSPTLFRAAVNEARAGNHKKSRVMLRQLLYDDPQNELAWLWLSKVSESREDKIDALEMALSLNPSRQETAVLLQKLKQPPPSSADPLDDLYQQATAAYQDGRSMQARLLLQQIVDRNRNYAKAWFGLGQIGSLPEDRLFALTVGLQLNPTNNKAQTQLTAMEADKTLNHFALAERFEAFGLTDTAVAYYQKAQQHASQAATRDAARDKQAQLGLQVKESNVSTTNPTLNLVRLTAGPIVLYLLFILIVSGINPLNVSLPLLAGALAVGLGSFFIASAHQYPAHPMWQQFLGSDEPYMPQQYLLTGIGAALLLLPFAFILLTNANEFIAYYATHPVNFSN